VKGQIVARIVSVTGNVTALRYAVTLQVYKSLPTPFVSAQLLSERTVVDTFFSASPILWCKKYSSLRRLILP
jgi:hypothetical protein